MGVVPHIFVHKICTRGVPFLLQKKLRNKYVDIYLHMCKGITTMAISEIDRQKLSLAGGSQLDSKEQDRLAEGLAIIGGISVDEARFVFGNWHTLPERTRNALRQSLEMKDCL